MIMSTKFKSKTISEKNETTKNMVIFIFGLGHMNRLGFYFIVRLKVGMKS